MADPVLHLSNLRKSFGALQATDNVSLSLVPGEIHALIGPNGAGKSTLIAQVSGRLRPDSGSITFRGRDITGLSVAQRARLGLGRSFQISSLIPAYSARRNVMLAVQARQGHSFRLLRPVQRDASLTGQADAILRRVGLIERAAVPAEELSHGERRLLEIAVALALEPACFLLDEPMAGMGTEGVGALVGFLRDLKHSAPILLVEHDMDAVFALADRISVLVYGRIIATGSVDEIRADPRVREAYLGDAA
ncbi:MAG: ABC transporter ATP-binding protein [Paracoccaceae bacterium]